MCPAARVIEAACLVAVCCLLVLHVLRFLKIPSGLNWWHLAVIPAGILLADLLSGIVHWIADTWGDASMPVIGARFVRPFRIHHINPEDFLRRDFIDANGDVAMINVPFLVGALFIPLESELGKLAAVFMVSFNGSSVPTNQVHQWAHMTKPPLWVRWLQRNGLILSPEAHRRHHTSPFVENYCINTGWCNGTLTELGIFPAAERIICRMTGLKPRSADSEDLN
jgi:ubiquitin-conjugating enzyme E2 variant